MSAGLVGTALVVTGAELEAAAAIWRAHPALALDTEFMRTDTFHPRLALVQVSDGERVWLVDPLALDDLSPLAGMLADPAVVKVLHSCSEDLEVLQHAVGCRPAPLYDTQVAAAMTGHGFSLSYRALVRHLLEVELDKQETRSDWLQRPLSAAQLDYAAADVRHLLPAHRRLVEDAERLHRMDWIAEEMTRLLSRAAEEVRPAEQYLRVKGAGRLGRVELAALRELAAWREREARGRNRPRGHLVNDAELLALAAARPTSRAALAVVDGLRPRVVREHGTALLAVLAEALDLPIEDCPQLLDQGPPERSERAFIRACRDWLAQRAQQLAIAPELLARRADLEQLARSRSSGDPILPPLLASGWRREVVAEPLIEFARHWQSGEA